MPLLGDVVLLPDELGEELLLLDVPPLEELLLPDLLKYASHSEREIEPSLFLSTDENDGVELDELLAPPEALGENDEEEELGEDALGAELLGEDEELLGDELLGEELLEAPPDALPEDLLLSVALGLELLGLELLGLELEDPLVLCAAATPAIAKSAAAVAVTTTFNFIPIPPRRLGEENCRQGNAIPMPEMERWHETSFTCASCSHTRHAVQSPDARRRGDARLGRVRSAARMARGARQSSARPHRGSGRGARALPGARPGNAARHAARQWQHAPGVEAERTLRARGGALQGDPPRPSRARPQHAAAPRMVGSALAGGAATRAPREDRRRTPDRLRSLVRRARRARVRARLSVRHARRGARFGLLLPDGAARRPVDGVSGDSTAWRPDAAHGLAAHLACIVAAQAEAAVHPCARAALLSALPDVDGAAPIAAA